ncbi:MAG: MOSC domain-containing protein [Acidimicrobiales bacterium]
MIEAGPYQFTEADAASTLALGSTLFDLLTDGLGSAAVDAAAPFRVRADAAVDEATATSPTEALGAWWDAWRAAMGAVRATGAFGPSAVGTATGLFTSGGGVPKQAVEAAEVGWSGVVGDRQRTRRHHGRPWQALCLWSTEVIDGLRADGHPLAPGLAGENISITGLAWERVRPGVRLQVGDVVAEVSAYAIPCYQNAGWFIDGNFDAMHHRHGPISRVYATVVEPGHLTVGDPVLLEPNPPR